MLMDIIKARHSIRKYTGEQIKRDDLEKILEAVWMPSSREWKSQ